MRKICHKVIGMVMLVFLCTIGNAQQRNVVWLHGYSGANTTWNNNTLNMPNALFAQFQILNNNRDTYTSNIGVTAYANEVIARRGALQGNNTLLIGHSMGGVVARHLIAPGLPQNFNAGAIISIGSPFSGVRAVNNFHQGQLANLLLHASSELSAGPIEILPYPYNFVFSAASVTILNSNATRDFIWDLALNLEQVEMQFNQTATELSANSAYTQNLRQQAVIRPHLALFGVTPSPVFYNIMGTSLTRRRGGDLQGFMQTVNDITNFYQISETFCFATMLHIPINYFRGLQWRKGRRYLQEGAESQWHQFIGAVQSGANASTWCEDVMVCDWDTYYMQCESGLGWDPIIPGAGCCMAEYCYTTYNQNNVLNDGFVNAISQQGFEMVNRPLNARVDNVNHLDMPRRQEVLDRLRDAMNGFYGPDFRTNVR